MRWQLYITQRLELFRNLAKVEPHFLSLSTKNQVFILFYGSQTNNFESINQGRFKKVISYVKATTRFDRPLIDF